jgi:hypothetical protein
LKLRTLIGLPLIAVGLLNVTPAHAQVDPRIGLAAGVHDAGIATHNMELVTHLPKPDGFVAPDEALAGLFVNSDLAFQGDRVFVGNYAGFIVYDISDPANPELVSSVVCPGGQGDPSVYGDLLFTSVEMPNGRVDCGDGPLDTVANPDRFRGVRIWDISDIENPEQVATIQTCRGSHTHTLVTDPNDDEHVYIYVSGTSFVRPEEELEGCSGADPEEDPNSSLFRIEVIRVPLDAPEEAEIVATPRIFADLETGAAEGLWPGGEHGPNTQETSRTDQCHDITVFPEIGLAAGACSGNGILLDISDPANPVRTDEVIDPNFAYWHSATFNNDATKVLFTDEWGGGGEARCRAEDPRDWGADAIFELSDDALKLMSYYKLPVVQGADQNCVAHNGSLIPVPGRDLMVQAWYQGGASLFDFTDANNPFEVAFFDRGPMKADTLEGGGLWSTYWYNGHIYGTEMGRGLDVYRLVPGEHLSENEIEAAKLVLFDELNVQHQERFAWPAEPVVAHALLDQLARENVANAADVRAGLDSALALDGDERSSALTRMAEDVEQGAGWAAANVAKRLRLLAQTLREMAEA